MDAVIEPAVTVPDTILPAKEFTNLTDKQTKFVHSFAVNGQSKLSAMNAGYPEKSAAVIGCQLLKNPKILNALDLIRTKMRLNISKEKYIDKAIETFEKLDITEPNSPRFYDIAGKALGYIGNNSAPITNNTQINIKADIISMAPSIKWDSLRSLLESE